MLSELLYKDYKTSQYIYIDKIKLQMQHDFRNCGPVPPIFYNMDANARNKWESRSNSLKVYIKTQQGEPKSYMIYIYVPLFNTWLLQALLRFLTILQNIIKGQILTTGMKMYAMENDILAGEALPVFEQQVKANRNKTKYNYKLVIKGMKTQFFLPKAL